MQFAIQDVRRLGFKKICQNFYTTIQGKVAFLERLRIENMMLSDIKASAYSLPKKYNSIYESLVYNYNGLIRFVDMCEPMMRSLDNPDSSVQRKVRNQWDSLWKCMKKDLDLSDDNIKMLKELGIRIAFHNESIVSSETYDFYNAILGWYVFTISECSIQELDLSPMDLISIMVLSSANDFIMNICKGFN